MAALARDPLSNFSRWMNKESCQSWKTSKIRLIATEPPYLLWRAVDEHGAELDILVKKRRDKAAERFFRRVLRSCPVPLKIVTDQLRSYPAAKADIPELANVKHVFVKAAARVNNRAEHSHQPALERERRMRSFRAPKRTQAFLSSLGPIRQHFALTRHRMKAARHREQLKARLSAWYDWADAQLPYAHQ